MNPPTVWCGPTGRSLFETVCESRAQSPTTTPMDRQVPAIMLMADSRLAGFTTVINAYRPDRVTGQIALLAKEHRVERLVLGHPINMDGTRGPRSEKAQAMRQLLEETTGLTVVLWDERRTTIDAHQILMSSGKNAKKRKKVVDAVAASLILEGYLTYLKTHPEG